MLTGFIVSWRRRSESHESNALLLAPLVSASGEGSVNLVRSAREGLAASNCADNSHAFLLAFGFGGEDERRFWRQRFCP